MNSFQDPRGEDVGRLKLIPEADRPADWVINDSTLSTSWEDADFGAYVPAGTKALLLYMHVINDGTTIASLLMRKNGSSETDVQKVEECYFQNGNADEQHSLTTTVLCDSAGIVEYAARGAFVPAQVVMTIRGYYI